MARMYNTKLPENKKSWYRDECMKRLKLFKRTRLRIRGTDGDEGKTAEILPIYMDDDFWTVIFSVGYDGSGKVRRSIQHFDMWDSLVNGKAINIFG